MKLDMYECKRFARDIVIDLYERGFGADGQLQNMIEFAETNIAEKILAHDRELLKNTHQIYVEAVKRCGD